jgi:hypothetical protein
MFFWNRTPANTVPQDPYTALPTTKNRRRSEPPAAFNLVNETQEQHLRPRFQSVVEGRWDEEGLGERKEEDERRVGVRPAMGRQRSRSAGENVNVRERAQRLRYGAGFESVYPGIEGGGVQMRAGMESEEEERSVRLQGMPPGVGAGMGMGMGRQRSRSVGESLRPYTRLHPQPHPHPHPQRQPYGRSGLEPVHADPSAREGGVRAGTGEAAGEERSVGLGRQRSRSAGEMHSRLYPHTRHHLHDERQQHQERRHVETVHTFSGPGNGQQVQANEGEGEGPHVGMSMGRQRSQSAGANVYAHQHPYQHPQPPPAFAQTRPLNLVDKPLKWKDSGSHHPPPASNAPLPPTPRSILRVRDAYSSNFDQESLPVPATPSSSRRAPSANQGPPPPAPYSPSTTRARTATSTLHPPLPSSHSRSRIPVPHSQGREQRQADGQAQNPVRGGSSMSSVLGRGVGIGRGYFGAGGLSLAPPEGKVIGIQSDLGKAEVRLDLPNPYPHAEGNAEKESGLLLLFFTMNDC